jgi:pimeloyl-ACP methyl ester carboxylesterase
MQHIKANGIEIACEITGDGPPIVLCHGGEADHRNFFNFAPVLAESFTVIAYDQRDSGETRNGTDPYTIGDLGRDVGALIEALGYSRAHVFGTSFGGVIAQEAVLNCPDKVDHLILEVTWPGPGLAVTEEFYKFAMSVKTPEQTRAYWQMFFSPEFVRASPDEVEARMKKVVITRSPEQRARRSQANATFNASPRLPFVRCPTLVISAGDDRIVLPQFPRRIAELIPGAQHVVLQGVGHATTLENPVRVAAEIRRFVLGR